MKITLDIPDGMRCICISGVMEKDRELLLVSSTVGSDNLYGSEATFPPSRWAQDLQGRENL